MIEVVYKGDKKKADGNEEFFKIPNNIRQIGEVRGHQKIYIEDYAYTFLKKISRNSQEDGKIAILYGERHWSEGCTYLFVKSALQIQGMDAAKEHIVFTEKIWGQVYEDSRKYFPEQEIIGWFVCFPGFNMEINEVLLKTHLNYFAGNDKVLFVMEPGEWEEAFFFFENDQLNRQPGYYVYYEKNEAMQNYMIAMSQNKSIEETEKVPDRAVLDFRKAINSKKENPQKDEPEIAQPEKNKTSHINLAAGICAAAVIMAVGITFVNSYQNMQGTLRTWIEGKTDAEQVEEQAAEQMDEKQSADSEGSGETAEASGTISSEKEAASETLGAVSENISETKEQTVSEEKETAILQAPEDSEKASTEETAQSDNNEFPEHQLPDETASAGQTETLENPAGEVQASVTGGMETGTQEYIIQRGDTLTSICRNYYGTIARIDEVCQLNGISAEDIIYAGQKLVLPK
ncbi:MAG: LysM peptidoglycan-binding domain-containing protein [Clostridia bacterium]|nr:LysM peptidoglycan-binding domain-containing protein [Clostridia bacterium]NCC42404.1 LysM peptidoglycan-binding domain-containing protein [Clostridia bacterium]